MGVSGLVEALAVDQEPQGFVDRASRAIALVVFVIDAAVDVGVLGPTDADARIAVNHEAFCHGNGDSAAGATGGAFPSPGAGEVGVPDALLVLRQIKLQPRPARSAEQGTLQVVVVGALASASGFGGFEYPLQPVPPRNVNQRLMPAGVGRAFLGHETDVVRVAEDLEERRTPGRALRRRNRGQAPRGYAGEQLDERCPLRVDLDGAVLAPLLVTLTNIQITNGRAHRHAAGLDLLRQPLGHSGGEVHVVEPGDARNDPVQ